jgi:hypothetical protein
MDTDDPVVLFRRANELVRERAGEFGAEGLVPFICECTDPDCLGRVEMSIDEYDEVRSRPTRAAVSPGHEHADRERVVQQSSRFAVVERLGTVTVAALSLLTR